MKNILATLVLATSALAQEIPIAPITNLGMYLRTQTASPSHRVSISAFCGSGDESVGTIPGHAATTGTTIALFTAGVDGLGNWEPVNTVMSFFSVSLINAPPSPMANAQVGWGQMFCTPPQLLVPTHIKVVYHNGHSTPWPVEGPYAYGLPWTVAWNPNFYVMSVPPGLSGCVISLQGWRVHPTTANLSIFGSDEVIFEII